MGTYVIDNLSTVNDEVILGMVFQTLGDEEMLNAMLDFNRLNMIKRSAANGYNYTFTDKEEDES